MKTIFLTYKCNNNCRFCYCSSDQKIQNHMNLKEIRKIIDSAVKKNEKKIELHGGEITLHPEFLKVCQLIEETDMKLHLVTNCRSFSYKWFTNPICNLKSLKSVYTSCHSHKPEIHDWLTRSKNSFNQTVNGIKNLLKHDIELTVNIVMLKQNVQELDKWVMFMNQIGVSRIRFSFPVIEGMLIKNPDKIVPKLNTTREYLQKAVDKAIGFGMHFQLEKGPTCLLSKYYDSALYSPRDKKHGIKAPQCNECEFYEKCVGVHKEYKELCKDYESELIPILNSSGL